MQETSYLRRIPHNIEAEMAVLGSVFVFGRKSYDAVRDVLKPEHFVLADHQEIFARSIELLSSGRTADPITLWPSFANSATVSQDYLRKLADSAVVPESATDYAVVVRDDACRRQLIGIADALSGHAYNGKGVSYALDQATADLSRVDVDFGYTRGSFRVEDAEELNAGTIPPREWVLGTMLARKNVTVMAASGGVGKSSIALAWAISMATGRPLVGDRVPHRARVLVVTAEDGIDEMRRRLRALRMLHGIDIIGQGWLSVLCLTGSHVSIARMNGDGGIEETGDADRIAETSRLHRADVVILDPFVKLSGAPENDNGATDVVMKALVRIADRCNVAVLVLHHVKKGAAAPGDASNARGASSMIDAARFAVTVTGMTTDEAATMGIPDEERVRLIRVDDAKANLVLKSPKARWYRLASINLGNGTSDYPNGDNVQAVEQWTPPDTWEGLDTATINDILNDLDAGIDGERYSDANAARDRAAWKAVQAHAPDKTAGQCKAIIKTWVKTGLLTVEEYQSPDRREPTKGLSVDASKRPS